MCDSDQSRRVTSVISILNRVLHAWSTEREEEKACSAEETPC
jgi:hypothetical protein